MIRDEWARLLIKHGFIKGKARSKYKKNENGFYEAVRGEPDPSDADMEEAEEVNIQAFTEKGFTKYLPTGYPDPYKRYRLIVEASKLSIEETYFWLLNYMRESASFPYIDKITDIFSASEQSAFWGAAQSRLAIQQDRASQYFKGMSEMIKQLFQLVRELRILDEKLEPRRNWGKVKAADVALKGEYTDLVENRGGQIQPGSIYHLAQQVGFTILPDLFFNTHVYSLSEIDKKVDALRFNKNVKNVLRRKLYAFVNWKLRTDKELEKRRIFTLKYLRQHWNVIKTYMSWVKPYLRNIARMQMSKEHIESPDIISAFETSMLEVELLAYKETKGSYYPCIIASFKYRTRPELSFQQDQYAHRGPIHVGRVEVSLRSYGWTKEQIQAYKNFKKDEDMLLLGMVDDSVKAAMDALGEELEKYLWEAGEKEFEEKMKAKEAAAEKKRKEIERRMGLGVGMLEPFISVFKGAGEMFSLFVPAPSSKGKKKKPKGSAKEAAKTAASQMYQMYKNYKKAHGMLSW
ncbi:MAG TPA: hypothetical protein ENL16_02925 [Candidatus Woesearchaeota archaeon]|nr:hypothetical protein [Candidatus Woesearchaeota archaeon]